MCLGKPKQPAKAALWTHLHSLRSLRKHKSKAMDLAAAPSETTRRRRGGRPVVAADTALACRISSACTREQRDQVRSAARSRGLTVSEYLLIAAIGSPLPRPLRVGREALQIFQGLAPLVEDLRAAGGLCNQLLTHLNEQAKVGAGGDTTEAVASVLRIEQLVLSLRPAIHDLRHNLNPGT